ncbi:hypothetical protein [Bacteroides ovatus]|uniref:hypothetical protein n=2 Tax=Bacteroides ovatus TaxID=28116 RepID=UPI002030EED4|nr:hypothetical protein [Bacteroides ovatus]MCM1722614.1 hypothetical protein [Bacteroides ovatus]MCM1869042.1 hypothetical protein [Bacteroides ovatus]MCM1912443.1 hypothetical protein [Bacteroides ovatus]
MKKHIGIIKIIALLFIFPITVWELTLKKTCSIYKENKLLESQVAVIGTIRPNSAVSAISATSPLLSNGKLLEMITDYLKEAKIEIVSYQPSLINEDNTYKLYAGTMVIRGNFISLVKAIDFIEKKKLPVKLSSARFSYTPAKGAVAGNTIELTLIFQQIEG